MHQGSSGRSRSGERGSTNLKKQMVASSDISQSYYSISPELLRSSAKKSVGVPMRCLIEEELIMTEKKTRHPSPGVIARLMGLDTLPPPAPKPCTDHQGPCHKKEVEASPIIVHREPSISHERYVFTEDELPEFKDVFEITEARKTKKKFHSSPVHCKNSSPEVEFVRKKFAEAKRLLTEEPLHSSREFNDTIEVLESNRDALLEFLSEPNSLFTKQVEDLSFLPPSPLRSASQITILKPSCKRTPGINVEICRDFDKDNDFHDRKHGNDLSNHPCEDDFVSLTFDKPLKSNYKVRGEKCTRPTNIVVLKPSLDKARKTVGTGAFPVPEVSSRSRFTNAEDSFVGTRAKSSREIARHVTRQMRRAVSAKPDYLRDVDPLYEFNPLYDDRSYYASPKFHHHVESSVSKEARKRLSDRWKTTHLTDEVSPLPGGGSNTLGEMLALSDIMSSEKSRKDKCILGISSNDGWKDGNFRNLPRSRSLPYSSHARLSHRSGHRRRGSRASEFGMLKDVLNAGPVKGLRGEKTHVSDVSDGEESVLTEREIHVNSEELKLKETEVKIGEVAPTKDASTSGETIPFDSMLTIEAKQLETDTVLDAIMKDEDIVSPTLHDDTEKQEVMEHRICLKEEEEQASPNSTLETPFEEVAHQEDEETSTSGCFEKISADLQELRMQLNLLKMDSVGEQGEMFLSSDEEDDNTEQTNSLELAHRDHFKDEEERDFSYLLDIVNDLGAHASTQDELLSFCYSLNCPVNPRFFTRLENKYAHLVLWPKSERKILFDLINLILSEIIGSWVEGEKMLSNFRPKWERDGFVEDLWGKVVKRRRDMESGSEEIFLEASWTGIVGKGVDLVGSEIENILHEDLIHELVAELVYCN